MAKALCWETNLAEGILSEEAPAGAWPCAPGAPRALIGGCLALWEHLQRVHAHLWVIHLQRTMELVTPESSQLVWADAISDSVHPLATQKCQSTMCAAEGYPSLCTRSVRLVPPGCAQMQGQGGAVQQRGLTFIFT